eukprot:184911-Pyramimonas_sp.AAC.1
MTTPGATYPKGKGSRLKVFVRLRPVTDPKDKEVSISTPVVVSDRVTLLYSNCSARNTSSTGRLRARSIITIRIWVGV